MMSIASNGGSPGSRPKKKTRMRVPTPPQRPRPMPPERTPSAMKPITIKPSIAISTQSLPLVEVDASVPDDVDVVVAAGVVVVAGAVVVPAFVVVVAVGAAAELPLKVDAAV